MNVGIDEYCAVEFSAANLSGEHQELLSNLEKLTKQETRSHRERLEAKKEFLYLQKEMAQYEL